MLEPIVHGMLIEAICKDCGFTDEYKSIEFGQVSCSRCLSQNVFAFRRGFHPPFPKVCYDLLYRQKLGEDVSSDLDRVLGELQSVQIQPDGVQYMLVSARFIERLAGTSYRDDRRSLFFLENVRGNLYRDYFRRTFVLGAGLKAVQCFETAIEYAPDDMTSVPIEHNLAMAVYSLIAKYPDQVVELLGNRTRIRELGLEAANRALVGYERQSNLETRAREIGRVHHLLGDLLVAGRERGEADIRASIAHYGQALAFLPASRFAINVRVSRANAIWKLTQPTTEESKTAIDDLEAGLSQPDLRLWPEQHLPRFMLGAYYAENGQIDAAIRQLEQASALALSDADRMLDEDLLYARVREYIPILSCLAWLYGKEKRAEDALGATEALRAATIHANTMSAGETAARSERAIQRSVQHLFGIDGPPVFKLPQVSQKLKRLRSSYPRASYVTMNIYRGTVTCVADVPGRFWRSLRLIERQIAGDPRYLVDIMGKYRLAWGEPSAFRERRLSTFFREMNQRVLGPLRDELMSLGLQDLILTAPGPLYGIPLDVLEKSDGSGYMASPDLRTRFVPSLSVAADIAERQNPSSGKLLAIGYLGSDLPNVRHEIDAITGAWDGNTTVMEGAGLNKRDVLVEMARGYDFIHFACHASFDELAPAQSALHLLADSDNDAMRVTAEDLRRLKLKTNPLITLSACSSGVASMDTGNDLIGLSGALFRAGARAVIGSRWPVYDDFSRGFMSELYTAFKASPRDPFGAFYEVRNRRSLADRLENWCAFSYLGL